MTSPSFKERVRQANLDLVRHGLVILTWGNASGKDQKSGKVVIKPSGIEYSALRLEHMVEMDMEGNPVGNGLRPSSDSPTHLEIYRAFPRVGGIVHTHSRFATMFAQAERPIPCLGTTHADYFPGEIPITRRLTRAEVIEDYERRTGTVIVERFTRLDPHECPGVLVAGHGVFTWGENPEDAVSHAVALEAVAEMAWGTLLLNPDAPPFPEYVRDKHYFRKHGPGAYYGQKNTGSPDPAGRRREGGEKK